MHRAANTIQEYTTQSHYPDTGPTSHEFILLYVMLSVLCLVSWCLTSFSIIFQSYIPQSQFPHTGPTNPGFILLMLSVKWGNSQYHCQRLWFGAAGVRTRDLPTTGRMIYPLDHLAGLWEMKTYKLFFVFVFSITCSLISAGVRIPWEIANWGRLLVDSQEQLFPAAVETALHIQPNMVEQCRKAPIHLTFVSFFVLFTRDNREIKW